MVFLPEVFSHCVSKECVSSGGFSFRNSGANDQGFHMNLEDNRIMHN